VLCRLESVFYLPVSYRLESIAVFSTCALQFRISLLFTCALQIRIYRSFVYLYSADNNLSLFCLPVLCRLESIALLSTRALQIRICLLFTCVLQIRIYSSVFFLCSAV